MRSTIIRITALILAAAMVLACGATLVAAYPQEEGTDMEESTEIPTLQDVQNGAAAERPARETTSPARHVISTPDGNTDPHPGSTVRQDEPVFLPGHAHSIDGAAALPIPLKKARLQEKTEVSSLPAPEKCPSFQSSAGAGTAEEYRADGDAADRYASLTLSEEDLELLARLVYLESRGEPYEGQVAVAEVVLNRVLSDRFPDTVEEVIYQAGQFTPASYIESTTPGAEQYEAVADAVNGETCVTGENVVFFSGAPYNDRIYAVIGNHYFCEL